MRRLLRAPWARHAAASRPPRRCAPTSAKMRGFAAAWAARQHLKKENEHLMDAERINAIGTLLADLTERTAALRGYL